MTGLNTDDIPNTVAITVAITVAGALQGIGIIAGGVDPPRDLTDHAAVKKYEDRVDFFFRMWDKDGSGEIQVKDLLSRLSTKHNETFRRIDELVGRWEKFDVDGDGKIQLSEFKKLVAEDNSAVETFTKLFQGDIGTLVKA